MQPMILLLSLLATPLSRTEVLEADWVDLADRAAHGEPAAERGLRAWLREAPDVTPTPTHPKRR